ncbi:MAG: NFYB/HAP3 family transcription factor subunit [Candidatus Micrarchaeota archaeon]|nr:NFYB/HAP3 family transcription factor subunit [Candidatus Micrarchaeota archaeon]
MYITESTVKRIMKEAGAKRISSDASRYLQKRINVMLFDISKKAVQLSKHAKRKTVDVSDVKLACN